MYNLLYKSLLPQQVMSPISAKSHRTFSAQKDQKPQSGQVTSRAKSEEKGGEKKRRDVRPMKPKKAPTLEDLTLSKRQKIAKQKLSTNTSLRPLCTRLLSFPPFFSIFYLLSIYHVKPTRRTRESQISHSRECRGLPEMGIIHY